MITYKMVFNHFLWLFINWAKSAYNGGKAADDGQNPNFINVEEGAIFVGDIEGPVGDVRGTVHGHITGTVHGSVTDTGRVEGTVREVRGNVNGVVEGHVGHIAGNLCQQAMVWTVEVVDGNIEGTVTGEGPYPDPMDTVMLEHVGGRIGPKAQVNVPVGNVEGDVEGTVRGSIRYIGGRVGREALVEGHVGRVQGDVNGEVRRSITFVGGAIGMSAKIWGSVGRVRGGPVNGHVQGEIAWIQGRCDGMQADTVTHTPVTSRNTGKPYPGSQIARFPVDEEQISWDIAFPEYGPQDYTARAVLIDNSLASDPVDPIGCPFNSLDNSGIMRLSYHGKYRIDPDNGRPMNPQGRTGIRGRGILPRWGPNHAGHAILTRFDAGGKLQFVTIKMGETGKWALPGGFVHRWESPLEAAIRHFREQMFGDDQNVFVHQQQHSDKLEKLWARGRRVYKGWMDDARNTDNAWVESTVVEFHDDKGLLLGDKIGQNGKWITVEEHGMPEESILYPCCRHMANLVAQKYAREDGAMEELFVKRNQQICRLLSCFPPQSRL